MWVTISTNTESFTSAAPSRLPPAPLNFRWRSRCTYWNETTLDYLTTRKAADILGVSLRTVQLWVENGQLEGWKTDGGHRRLSHAAVEMKRVALADGLVAQQKPNPMPVLIVEDDESLLHLYRVRIRAWPFPTILYTAPNGYEALVLIGELKPWLLVCDLRLPGVNGFQIVRALCNMNRCNDLSIVVVSGLEEVEIRAHGGVPERVAIMGKPVDFSLLKEIGRRRFELGQSARS